MNKDKKLSIPSMAMKNLIAKKFRTAFMMFFVVLMSATLFFSSILMDNLQLGIDNTTKRMGAEMIVVPREATDDMRSSLFAGEPCSFFFDRAWEEAILGVEGVEKVSSQLYIATLSASCCDQQVQMVVFDPATDFVVKPWLEETNKELVLNEGEIVIGSKVQAVVGDTLTFYNTDFKVVEVLEETGMGYDRSVFMTYETVERLREPILAQGILPKDKEFSQLSSMILLDVADEVSGMFRVNVEKALDVDYKMKAFTADELVSSIADQVNKLSGYGNILTTLLVISTALALISIFVITINERKYEFGILYTLGANKVHVTGIILSEALIISIVGGVLGSAVSYYLVTTFRNMISVKLDIPYFNTDMEYVLPIIGMCMLISIATGIVAAICSSYKISKGETYRLIRESE